MNTIRKNMQLVLLSALAPALGFVMLSACDANNPSAEQDMSADSGQVQEETFQDHAEKHLDPTYACPMHPEVTSDEPGECPICGMTLVERKSSGRQVAAEEGEILYYRHPHNPQITSPEPATDEMGMNFIPIRANAGGGVSISPGMVQTLGVRTAVAERDKLWRRIDTVGYIDYNESLLRHIHPRAAGWIETLSIRSAGERVAKGDVLFHFYSPDIINAQEEFISALASGSERLKRVSRTRLRALDVADQDIERIERTRKVVNPLPFYAPRDEVVSDLNVREGMYVTPAMEVMALADLSSVWLVADVFAAHANWVAEGQLVEATLPYRPGETWQGRVDFVSPVLDPKTRTVEARLKFLNPDEALKPNMFANVSIFGGPKEDIVIIPREALIRTGKESRVVMSEGDGKFSSRIVVAGMESGEFVEIVAGIEPGETVVTSGQFLIDSESSLNASMQRLQDVEPADARADEHDEAEHDMRSMDDKDMDDSGTEKNAEDGS